MSEGQMWHHYTMGGGEMGVLAVVLALVWGVAWALFLQRNRTGRFLALRRTWVTVVVGVGLDLVIMLMVVPLGWWIWVAAIVVASSLGIIARSLINERRGEEEMLEAMGDVEDEAGEQDDLVARGLHGQAEGD